MDRPLRCPGQDQQFWKPEDIFFITCPYCQAEIEFWKDEPLRLCPVCRQEIRNPRLDFGCAKWCKQAHECLGALPEAPDQMGTICERILAAMKATLGEGHPQIAVAEQAMRSRPKSLEARDPLVPARRAAWMLRPVYETARGEGEAAARSLLHQAGFTDSFVEQVVRLLDTRAGVE